MSDEDGMRILAGGRETIRRGDGGSPLNPSPGPSPAGHSGQHSSHSTRVPQLLAIACLILSLVAVSAPRSALAATNVRFDDMRAMARFPARIDFHVKITMDTPARQITLFWHPVGVEEMSADFLDTVPGAQTTIDHAIDLSLDYLPPGVEIGYFWRVTDEKGRITDSPEQFLLYMDDRHDWSVQTDGLVTLHWYEGTEEFAGDTLTTANGAIDRLSQRFGVNASEPMRIIIYGNDRDFAAALPPNSADWIGGQAFPSLNLIVAVIQPGRSEHEIGRMIPHEVSHLILHQATENPWNAPPAWLDEGLAVYNQEVEDERLVNDLESAIEDGRLIPVRALNSSFPYDPDRALLSYAESWSIVAFIIDELGDDEMAELVAAFREGVSYDAAVQRSLGMSIDELDARWKASLGYDGDRPVPESGGVVVDAGSGTSPAGWAVLLGATGVGTLFGLALVIVSVRQLRRVGRNEG